MIGSFYSFSWKTPLITDYGFKGKGFMAGADLQLPHYRKLITVRDASTLDTTNGKSKGSSDNQVSRVPSYMKYNLLRAYLVRFIKIQRYGEIQYNENFTTPSPAVTDNFIHHAPFSTRLLCFEILKREVEKWHFANMIQLNNRFTRKKVEVEEVLITFFRL